MKTIAGILLAAALLAAPASAVTISEKTAGMQRFDGFLPLYWDGTAGVLYMEISRFDEEILYVSSLAAGLGSNDIGLDRGQLGETAIIEFRRVGPKVLMVQPNYSYRAVSDNPEERLAVEEAFAVSTLWGFTAAAESDGRVLVDLTDFLLRDTHGVAGSLKPASYRLEKSRSAVYLPRSRSFPKNTELEALVTFVTDGTERGPGQYPGTIADVAPAASAVSLRLHHSFVEAPPPGFEPRPFDPRAGYFGISYVDYATPLGQPMTKRFIARHRLNKDEPFITYHLDPGTPEPMRSALLDGARWWNEAFEAAGYRNGFRVEMLPAGVDPLDARYNVIQWVHRSTRGWAYGSAVIDPRTGEIVKGHVTLDSMRVRQDYLIAEGLLSPYETGTEQPTALSAMALARLRQLSAHEIGHTLGLAHNYYNSEKGRISVMDYPHPLVELRDDGAIDLSDAYANGIGEWDKVAIRWGYADVDAAAQKEIIETAWAADLRFMTNQDLDLDPGVDQWAHGTEPAAELARVANVRRAALARFGERAIQKDWPLALLEEALVPLFLHHRYQIQATAAALGGVSYRYALRGDGLDALDPVPAADQRAALDAILAVLRPAELTIPKTILDQLPPRPMGYRRHRELFPRYTGAAFDPLTPATVAADIALGAILDPERAARLIAQSAVDPNLPGLDDVLNRLVAFSYEAPAANAYEREIRRSLRWILSEKLMSLAATAPMPQVRAQSAAALRSMRTRSTSAGGAFDTLLAAEIERFLERPAEPQRRVNPPQIPPGAPIG